MIQLEISFGRPRKNWVDSMEVDVKKKILGWKMEERGFGSCPIAAFGTNGIQTPGYVL
jgi:hypothetical protein